MPLEKLLKIIAAASLLTGLAACGFTPLYADRNTNLTQNFASIDVARIDSQSNVGYVLESMLEKRLGSDSDSKDYFLSMELEETIRSEAITREADTVIYDYILEVEYVMTNSRNETVLDKSVSRNVSYGVSPSQYATEVTKEDAIERAAEQVVDEIELELLLLFQNAGSGQ